ncbi:hypothetical protein KVT40_008614 [Elsinoe batatas]|uniref:Uncharacterized protein n=1 Tax=Elsinoe batatas TaxID=2601811 RepID=A0A8K0PE04_9PEZI|nr:hypothetical protein KVT40_008614 [Elsinoe batatas]
MKFASTLLALPAVATAAFYPPEMYQRGEVHQMILNMKNEQWNAMEVAGLLNSSQYPSWKTWDQLDKKVKNDCLRCRDGLAIAEQGNANYTFRCNNMDAYDFLNHADMVASGRGRDGGLGFGGKSVQK